MPSTQNAVNNHEYRSVRGTTILPIRLGARPEITILELSRT
jgi:hypothetical protein